MQFFWAKLAKVGIFLFVCFCFFFRMRQWTRDEINVPRCYLSPLCRCLMPCILHVTGSSRGICSAAPSAINSWSTFPSKVTLLTDNMEMNMCTASFFYTVHNNTHVGQSLHNPAEHVSSPAVNDFEASEQAVFAAYCWGASFILIKAVMPLQKAHNWICFLCL